MKLPNLDAMTDDELLEMHTKVEIVLDYIDYKRGAIYNRLKGDIHKALYYEKMCENLYSGVPKEWRW